MSDPRQRLHQLIDDVPAEQLDSVAGVVEDLLEPETISDAERLAVAEATEWLKHNKAIPHEVILADFGLTMADWEKMCRERSPDEAPPRSG